VLQEYAVVPHLFESFYAITVQRHFEPPLLKALLQRDEAEVLGKATIASGFEKMSTDRQTD
jgi:LysR family transcriptional activator of nhaA